MAAPVLILVEQAALEAAAVDYRLTPAAFLL
jgi:hypothetical protein